METCVFCRSKLDIVFENETCFAIFDRNPVTQGHLLILPKAHREDYFSLTERELADTDKLVKLGKNTWISAMLHKDITLALITVLWQVRLSCIAIVT